MGIFLCLRSKHNPTCGKNKKEERFILMKKFLSILLAILMLAVMLPVTAMAVVGDGSSSSPYTLAQFNALTRQQYIDAQNQLGGTMYVTVDDYSYDTNGVLGNGVRDDTVGQTPDHSKMNAYGENGYLGNGNDGANGRLCW